MIETIRSHPELRERGFRALAEALGWPNAVRFLREYEAGAGDYTDERRSMLPEWPLDKLVAGITDIQRRSGLDSG